MSDNALMREADRCRRLARQATDQKLVAMLEAIACEYEARTFHPRTPEPLCADTAAAVRRSA